MVALLASHPEPGQHLYAAWDSIEGPPARPPAPEPPPVATRAGRRAAGQRRLLRRWSLGRRSARRAARSVRWHKPAQSVRVAAGCSVGVCAPSRGGSPGSGAPPRVRGGSRAGRGRLGIAAVGPCAARRRRPTRCGRLCAYPGQIAHRPGAAAWDVGVGRAVFRQIAHADGSFSVQSFRPSQADRPVAGAVGADPDAGVVRSRGGRPRPGSGGLGSLVGVCAPPAQIATHPRRRPRPAPGRPGPPPAGPARHAPAARRGSGGRQQHLLDPVRPQRLVDARIRTALSHGSSSEVWKRTGILVAIASIACSRRTPITPPRAPVMPTSVM